MSDDARRLRHLRSGAPQGFSRRLYCLACSHIWSSIELPEGYVHELLAKDRELEQLRRELAMARLLLAKDQQVAASPASEKKQSLRVRRAA
jgi:hypothetical protein